MSASPSKQRDERKRRERKASMMERMRRAKHLLKSFAQEARMISRRERRRKRWSTSWDWGMWAIDAELVPSGYGAAALSEREEAEKEKQMGLPDHLRVVAGRQPCIEPGNVGSWMHVSDTVPPIRCV